MQKTRQGRRVNNPQNKPELLVPAGGNETLEAAVKAGADAVYMGMKAYGARHFAANFSEDEIKNAIDYCHKNKVLAYITLNTIIADNEINDFLKKAAWLASEGADAFIIQDYGALSLLKKHIKEIPLHASTQMTVHNREGAIFAKEQGFERVILSRELSFENIKNISRENIDTEIFVHGALCYSYSGQCLMSSIIGARSGNRGKCAQPCRLPYELLIDGSVKEKGYLLNTYDLCLANDMTKLLKSGARAFKIEGRMKGADYVYGVTSVYRRLIDENRNIAKDELEYLKSLFCRGSFTKGFFSLDKPFNTIRKDTSNENIKAGKAIFSESVIENGKFDVEVYLYLKCGEKPVLTLTHKGIKITEKENESLLKADKPLPMEKIKVQLYKTGNYPVNIVNTDIDTDGAHVPLSLINSLRRQALERLFEEIIKMPKRSLTPIVLDKPAFEKKEMGKKLTIEISSGKQLKAALDTNAEIIYVPIEIYGKNFNDLRIIPIFPDIIKDEYMQKYIDFLNGLSEKSCIYTGNTGIINHANKKGFKIYGSSALNIFNSFAVGAWQEYGLIGAELSRELKLFGINEIAKNTNFDIEVTVYGKYALMQTAFCPLASIEGKCSCEKDGNYCLRDRKGEKFPVMFNKNTHTACIYNCKPLYFCDKIDEIKYADRVKLVFTNEDEETTQHVLYLFNSRKLADFEYTRGHFYRGVQ